MNLTLALIAGFAVLLPGLGALAFWNIRLSRSAVRRPELAISSPTALFMVLAGSALLHSLGIGLTTLLWSAAVEVGSILPPSLTRPEWPRPYDVALALLSRSALNGAPGSFDPGLTAGNLLGLLLTLGLETTLAVSFIGNDALDLFLDGKDVSGQGWTYRAVIRPVQHGFTPVAYILTNPPQGTLGLGYQGVVADIRQGADGELKFISLAEPESFAYEVRSPERAEHPGGLQAGDRRRLGGVMVIEGSAIRNILVRAVDSSIIEAARAVGPGADPT